VQVAKNNHVYVCDMGLTKLVEQASVTVHSTEGTYAYMAPECFDKATRKTSKVDVYSFGCVLIELYTEKKVWGDNTLVMIMNAVVVQKSSPNTAGLPGGIKELVDGCIQRPPLIRPTFGDVLRMLNALKE